MKIVSTIFEIIGLLFIVILIVMIVAWAIEQIPKRTLEIGAGTKTPEESLRESQLYVYSHLLSSPWVSASANPPASFKAYVTGYNTTPGQTDSTPCYAGDIYICGRDDVVACPRWIPKHTWVEIGEKLYECVDRLALKYDSRFDISCDKDFVCPYEITGWREVKIIN